MKQRMGWNHVALAVAVAVAVVAAGCKRGFESTDAAADAAADPRVSITVRTTGAGSGAIAATIGGAPCDEACLASLVPGTVVHFTAAAAPASWFHGWTTGCDGRHACDVEAVVTV